MSSLTNLQKKAIFEVKSKVNEVNNELSSNQIPPYKVKSGAGQSIKEYEADVTKLIKEQSEVLYNLKSKLTTIDQWLDAIVEG